MAKTDEPYRIHFVCRGNVHRSRLAEAYMNLLAPEGLAFSSSGVEASRYEPQYKSPVTAITLNVHPELQPKMSRSRVQTTKQLLDDADVVICLDKSVFDDAIQQFELDSRKAQVWHVEDIDKRLRRVGTSFADSTSVSSLELDIFSKIRHLCDKLRVYLTSSAWLDVVDEQNEPLGMRLPISWITDRGLWHRAVHVVAQTADGKYVVEKRSKQIVFAPGMLEVSLGGGVDAGEHPLQSAMRETHEELGVHVSEAHFKPLFMYKHVGYHPHYHKQTKGHVYVYAARLPVHSKALHPQLEEVAEIRTLNRGQVKHLLRTHRLRHFGKLSWPYKLYNKAVAYSSLPV